MFQTNLYVYDEIIMGGIFYRGDKVYTVILPCKTLEMVPPECEIILHI